MPSIAVYVSPHGFGHAARASAVVNALHRLMPELRFELFTTVPDWFFAESLTAPFGHHPVTTDVGLVQRNAFDEDLGATVDALDRFLPFADSELDRLATELDLLACTAVLCDISPLGLAVAGRAGKPAALLENFTWDWIYGAYADQPPALSRHSHALRQLYATADVRVQATPYCQRSPGAFTVAPISRQPVTPPVETRRRLEMPSSGALILLTLGGIPWRHDSLGALEDHPTAYFVVPGGAEEERARGHLRVLPHRSTIFHPDLVAAADIVIGKLGYSTLAETYHAGCAFGFIPRQRFPESAALARFALSAMPAVEIQQTAFVNGEWLARIDQLLALPRPAEARPNGADEAARLLAERLLT